MVKKDEKQVSDDFPINLDDFSEEIDSDLDEVNTLRTRKVKNKPVWLFTLIVVVGLMVFFLAYYDVIGRIYFPFFDQATYEEELPNQEAAYLFIELQTRDTDEDTLSDYEELYLYGTSPYLADSDSDGVSDAVEISQETDPNCPKGQICGRVETNTNSSVANTNQAIIEGDISADQLREALKQSGASASVVDNLDDATLQQAYTELLTSEQPDLANLNTANTNAGLDPITLSNLENMSAAEIRLFLELGGADSAALADIDDATIVNIFRNSLQELM